MIAKRKRGEVGYNRKMMQCLGHKGESRAINVLRGFLENEVVLVHIKGNAVLDDPLHLVIEPFPIVLVLAPVRSVGTPAPHELDEVGDLLRLVLDPREVLLRRVRHLVDEAPPAVGLSELLLDPVQPVLGDLGHVAVVQHAHLGHVAAAGELRGGLARGVLFVYSWFDWLQANPKQGMPSPGFHRYEK